MKLAIVLAGVLSCTTWSTTGSLLRAPCTHVGVRPASDGQGAAATVQLSTDWPMRCAGRP